MVDVQEALLFQPGVDWIHYSLQVDGHVVGQTGLKVGKRLPGVARRHKVPRNDTTVCFQSVYQRKTM